MRKPAQGMKRRLLQQGVLALLFLAPALNQAALAREATRVADLPRDFRHWAAWRADEASLAKTAKGLPTAGYFHGADFCVGARTDPAIANELAGGLALHAMAFCPAELAALRGAGQVMPSAALLTTDGPRPSQPSISQTLCAPAIRQR